MDASSNVSATVDDGHAPIALHSLSFEHIFDVSLVSMRFLFSVNYSYFSRLITAKPVHLEQDH
jgi:hypothetical protein